jgi:hypothetical protein
MHYDLTALYILFPLTIPLFRHVSRQDRIEHSCDTRTTDVLGERRALESVCTFSLLDLVGIST